MDKTVTQIMEQIKEDICDDYCKWPERYRSMYKDPDEAQERMIGEVCEICPLQRL